MIFCHIGHGKTGSTYLQFIFSKYSELLSRYGLTYPFSKDSQHAANKGITSGNGSLIFDQTIFENCESNLLFSSESLFHELIDNPRGIELLNSKKDSLSLLLVVRNPESFLYSSWAQQVKRAGESRSFHDYVAQTDDIHFPRILAWLNLSTQIDLTIRVLNYSKVSNNILDATLAWLFPKHSKALYSSIATEDLHAFVNMTISKSQLGLVRILNKKNPRLGRNFADYFTDSCALQEPSTRLNFSSEVKVRGVLELIRKKYGSTIAEINAFLGEDSRMDFIPPSDCYNPYVLVKFDDTVSTEISDIGEAITHLCAPHVAS